MASASLPSRPTRIKRARRRPFKLAKASNQTEQRLLENTQDEEEQESLSADKAERSAHAVLYYKPRARAISPYQPASEQDELRLRSLVHHFTTVVARRSVTPVGPRHEWFPFAAVDEALFHAVMSHTAAHSAYLRRVPLQNEAHYFWHIGQAIRLVNERLAAGLENAATEGTICTVCCLGQQQAFSAQVDGSIMHLNGLIRLVNAAGGIESINMNPKTRRYVMLTDLAASITLNKRFHLLPHPQLCSPDLKSYFGPATLNTEHYARTFSTRLYNFTENAALSIQAFNVYWGLRNLTIMVENIHAGRDTPDSTNAHELQFTDRVEVLERALHPLWFEDLEADPTPSSFMEVDPTRPSPLPADPASSKSSTHSTSASQSPTSTTSSQSPPPTTHPPTPSAADMTPFRLLGYASLIHIYVTLRELPPQLKMLKLIASRIHARLTRLSKAALNMLLATFPDLCLWVMFLAGSVAGELRLQRWFAAAAARVLAVREKSRAGVAAGGAERGESGPGGEEREVEVEVDRSEAQRAATRFLWPEEVVLDPA